MFYINTGGKCRNLLKLQIKEKNKFVLIIATCKDEYPLIKFYINEIISYKVICVTKTRFFFYVLTETYLKKKMCVYLICNCGNVNIFHFIYGHK